LRHVSRAFLGSRLLAKINASSIRKAIKPVP